MLKWNWCRWASALKPLFVLLECIGQNCANALLDDCTSRGPASGRAPVGRSEALPGPGRRRWRRPNASDALRESGRH